jgi:hypothetical protein
MSFTAIQQLARAFGNNIVVCETALNKRLQKIPPTIKAARREAG